MCALPPILAALPRATLEVITGNQLGDGSLRYPNFGRDGGPSGNARYEMTMSAAAYQYMLALYNNVYALYSASGLKP